MEPDPSAVPACPDPTLHARVFHETPVGLAMVGPVGEWLDVNAAFCALVGRTREEVLAAPLRALLHPHDAAADVEDERRLRAGEASAYESAVRYVRRDGGTVQARTVVSLLDGEPPQAPRMLRALPEALTGAHPDRAAAEQLAAIVATQQELALSSGDLDSVLSVATARARWLTRADGARIELLDGQDIVRASAAGLGAELLPRRPRGDSLAGRAALAGRVIRVDDAAEGHGSHHAAAAELGARSFVLVPLQHEHGVVGALTVVSEAARGFDERDVQVLQLLAELIATAIVRSSEEDARRQLVDELTAAQAAYRHSEARMRRILDTAGDAFLCSDEAGVIIDWNTAAEELFGWPREEAIGLPALSLIPPRDHAAHEARRQALLTAGRRHPTGRRIELVARDRAGREFPAEATVTVASGPDGRRFLHTFLHDIGERKLAELEREVVLRREREQVERLRELDRLKDEFVSVVSHELRTPLTSITGYLDIVLEGEAGPLSDEQDGFLAVVDRNARRLVELVDDLLFVSRLDSGTQAFERTPVDPVELVGDCVEGARPLAASRDVELRTSVGTSLMVMGDAARLAQLLDNLVANAVKFTPGGGTVEVRLRAEADAVVLEVEDTGIGIPAAEQDRIFQRFFRSSSATERAIQGTGLGLAICRGIVEGHGGRISFTSAEGRGTTFQVRLPAAHAADLAA